MCGDGTRMRKRMQRKLLLFRRNTDIDDSMMRQNEERERLQSDQT